MVIRCGIFYLLWVGVILFCAPFTGRAEEPLIAQYNEALEKLRANGPTQEARDVFREEWSRRLETAAAESGASQELKVFAYQRLVEWATLRDSPKALHYTRLLVAEQTDPREKAYWQINGAVIAYLEAGKQARKPTAKAAALEALPWFEGAVALIKALPELRGGVEGRVPSFYGNYASMLEQAERPEEAIAVLKEGLELFKQGRLEPVKIIGGRPAGMPDDQQQLELQLLEMSIRHSDSDSAIAVLMCLGGKDLQKNKRLFRQVEIALIEGLRNFNGKKPLRMGGLGRYLEESGLLAVMDKEIAQMVSEYKAREGKR
ncbi:hypothetical protein DB346_00175 [Verrucomicrobia bacterium LW23]|nr:hypothetical protein DB346_00175 [Verrucomicrobia bacterium LW23]